MALEALEHYTINCADLAARAIFIAMFWGWKRGRGPIGFAGHWLYAGDVPVVHLWRRWRVAGKSRAAQGGPTGSLDHIAFRGAEPGPIIARLKARGIAYRENVIADFKLHQLFVRDPNGIMVEMNFRG